jgi:hypothetical protein
MMRILTVITWIMVASTHVAEAKSWQGHGGNAQHTAVAPAPAQNLHRIAWTTPIDLKPQLTNGELLIHYGSPIVTAANTLILAVKTGTTDGFRIEARNAKSGGLIWSANSAYRFPSHDWIPSYSPVLTSRNRLYFAGVGGTIRYRDTPDLPTGTSGSIAFYGNSVYRANSAAYDAAVQITTPLTADTAGNVYFGFTVSGAGPKGLVSGIARVGTDGKGTWISAAAAAGDPDIKKVQTNCAPAISSDQKTVYIAVSNGPHIGFSDGYSGYLVGLDAGTLKHKYAVRLKEPSDRGEAVLSDDSTASPTIGPDGDIFFGVLERLSPFHNARGWLLHFDSTLKVSKIPGSFGWDNTPSVLPASIVPSYKGASKYLLMSKYNNYAGFGTGNGHNEIAILDPGTAQRDRYSTSPVPVMKEVMTIAGPTAFPGGSPGQTYEWCIDSAAIDPATASVFANSEDGHLYRWDLKTNSISQHILLNPPRPEAYTPTVVGVDGTVYAINNATFYAIKN